MRPIYANFGSSLTTFAINAADGTNFGANQAGVNIGKFNATTVIGVTMARDSAAS